MRKLTQSVILATITSGLALSFATGCGSSSNGNNFPTVNGPNNIANIGRLRLELQFQNPQARVQGRISDAERSFRIQLLDAATGADRITPITVQRQSGVTSQFVDLDQLPLGNFVVRITGFDANGQAISFIDLRVTISDGNVISVTAANFTAINPGDPPPPPPVALDIQRVSVSTQGAQGDGSSATGSAPTLSADGRYVAFASEANNLSVGGEPGLESVYVRDRQQNTTTRINLGSLRPRIAGDGSRLVYEDDDQILVSPVDAGAAPDTVSQSTAAQPGNLSSFYADISNNGQYSIFYSTANNLVPDDSSGTADIFFRDIFNGTTVFANILPNGTRGPATQSAISANGNRVVFISGQQIYMYEPDGGNRQVVSLNVGESNAVDTDFREVGLNADGRFVVFSAENGSNEGGPDSPIDIVEGDTNGVRDVYVRDMQEGVTTRVSVSSSGQQGNAGSVLGDEQQGCRNISGDGRFVVFESAANNLVEGDTNNFPDVFLHDRDTGQTIRLSLAVDGAQGNSYSGQSSISEDGRTVVFVSLASNLVHNDTNNTYDVFVVGNPLAPELQ